jgi:hypothetical protein
LSSKKVKDDKNQVFNSSYTILTQESQLMSEENLETLWVIVDDVPQIPQEDGSKDATFRGNPWTKSVTSAVGVTKAVQVSTQKLEAEMSKFLQIVSQFLLLILKR